jgi:hypothetical protein
MAIAGILLLAGCGALRAQAKFNGQIQPGVSARSDVDAALGAPIKQDSATTFDYQPPQGAKSLKIEYRADGVVNRVQAEFAQPYGRDALRQALGLPDESQGTRVLQGVMAKYFGAPAYLIFVYASADPGSGVHLLQYNSAEAFQREAAGPSQANPPPPSWLQPTPAPGKRPAAAAPDAQQQPQPQQEAQPQPHGQRKTQAQAQSQLRVPAQTQVQAQPQIQSQPSGSPGSVPIGCLKQVTVNLVTAISSESSKADDTIEAQAVLPVEIKGDMVEGTIHRSDCSTGDGGVLKCVMNFSFDSLTHNGETIPMTSQMVTLANSKGWPHVDEEGNVVTQRGNYVDVITRREIAATLGGSVPGPRPDVFIELSTNAAKLSFGFGAQFKIVLHSDTPPIPELQCAPRQ